MRFERFETGYKMSDTYIAAAILCEKDMEFAGVELVEGNAKQSQFVIKGDPDRIKKIIDQFFNAKLSVDASLYKTKLQLLRMELHAR